jgi:hypothetical protein
VHRSLPFERTSEERILKPFHSQMAKVEARETV